MSCSRCKIKGHNKNNRNCPLFNNLGQTQTSQLKMYADYIIDAGFIEIALALLLNDEYETKYLDGGYTITICLEPMRSIKITSTNKNYLTCEIYDISQVKMNTENLDKFVILFEHYLFVFDYSPSVDGANIKLI